MRQVIRQNDSFQISEFEIEETFANNLKEAERIRDWCINGSWFTCPECECITKQQLSQAVVTGTSRIGKKHCNVCQENGISYFLPKLEDFPVSLRNLPQKYIWILRPVELVTNGRMRARHGYLCSTLPTKIKFSTSSVSDKLEGIRSLDEELYIKIRNAYEYLMSSPCCRLYQSFSQRRDIWASSEENLQKYLSLTEIGVECALFPDLYPSDLFSESLFCSQYNNRSMKRSFMKKVLSSISDYSFDSELLIFQTHRYLFSSTTGAINMASKRCSNPGLALSDKPFSGQYWKDNLLCLNDAVRQFGLPDIFLTLSCHDIKGAFPMPYWLEKEMRMRRLDYRQASICSIHILHIMEQVMLGFVCGKTSTSRVWTQQMIPTKFYFYRIEFQDRGTPHCHMLVWTSSIPTKLENEARATLLTEFLDVNNLVKKIQISDKQANIGVTNADVPFARLQDSSHGFDLTLRHLSTDTFVRPFLCSLIVIFRSHMDFQYDGKKKLSHLSTYVTKYVSKMSGFCLDGERQICAAKFVNDFLRRKMAETEMWALLSSNSLARSGHGGKTIINIPELYDYLGPYPDWLESYWGRDLADEGLCLIEYLRLYHKKGSIYVRYSDINIRKGILVGIRMKGFLTDEAFGQYLIVYKPHRKLAELHNQHPRKESVPLHLRCFADAYWHLPLDFLESAFRKRLASEGHKKIYIDAIIASSEAHKDLLKLIYLGKIADLSIVPFNDHNMVCNEEQRLVIDKLMLLLNKDSAKILCTVEGGPGSGKSFTLMQFVIICCQRSLRVLICTPTGMLTSMYRGLPENVIVDTLHAAFNIPLTHKPSGFPQSLNVYDVIIIDEISMVNPSHWKYIMDYWMTLDPFNRPLMITSGDFQQLLPVMRNPKSCKNSWQYISGCHFYLTEQHRSKDQILLAFLNKVRNKMPSLNDLETIRQGRIVRSKWPPADDDFERMFNNCQNLTVLTYTNATVDRVNHIAIRTLFPGSCVGMITSSSGSLFSIYVGMRLMLTRNVKKTAHFVNGMRCVVVNCNLPSTITVRTDTNMLTNVWPVPDKRSNMRVWPLIPAYCLTIHKVQGQSIRDNVCIFFDEDNLPPGLGYVAISRLTSLDKLKIMGRFNISHFHPVRI